MFLRNQIKKFLLKRNMIISQPPGQFNQFGWKLQQLKNRGAQIQTVLDGGAHAGEWSQDFVNVYPEVTSVLVEPRSEVQPLLKEFQATRKNCIVLQALLGASEGEVTFQNEGERSSILPNAAPGGGGKTETAHMLTIDGIVQKHGLGKIDLIKLDLQGAELIALTGATETLKTTQFVLLEVSLMPFQKGQPIVDEVVGFMKARNFVLYDISGLWCRSLDGALAQGDFLFIRQDHPLRSDLRWEATR
jgi:FkbM family methyltransferase